MPGNDVKHTFIPKAPVLPTGSAKQKRGSFGIVLVISILIFVVSVLLAIFAYSYRAFMTSNVANLEISLNKARAAFEPDTILALKRFNARVNTANTLLSRHIAPTTFFAVLQDLTLQNVRFTKLAYIFDGASIETVLTGLARSYNSVALQSDLFAKSPYIKNPIFSDLTLDRSGNVTFAVTFNIDPALVLYSLKAKQGTFQQTEPTNQENQEVFQ